MPSKKKPLCIFKSHKFTLIKYIFYRIRKNTFYILYILIKFYIISANLVTNCRLNYLPVQTHLLIMCVQTPAQSFI